MYNKTYTHMYIHGGIYIIYIYIYIYYIIYIYIYIYIYCFGFLSFGLIDIVYYLKPHFFIHMY